VPSYGALKNKQNDLIRKATDGSVFVAPVSAPAITTLTTATGTAPNQVIDLTALPTDWDDLGWLSSDGAQFSRDVSTSDVTSWGSVTPTRSDITADTSTLQVACHETKLLTIGLGSGADVSGIVPDATTGEVSVAKPNSPSARFYRVLALAVDSSNTGDIYIGRFFPRARVTAYTEQAFGGGDDPIMWGVTWTGMEDSTLGYSERWLFGGAGWQAQLEEMGFTP
jgi:hypothetical protein